MARGRMTNTTIALDPEFNAMSLEAQFLFLRTLPHLDRDGLIIGQPTALWAMIAPLMPQLLAVMPKSIDEWMAAGFVRVIDTKIGPVLYFKRFHDNQIGMRYDREPPSRIPLPEGIERTHNGLIFPSGNLPAIFRQDDGNPPTNCPPEVEVEVEVERERVRARVTEKAPPPTSHTGYRHEKLVTDTYMSQARDAGLEPQAFSGCIDELAGICGKRSYINAVESDNATLNHIKESVIALTRLGYSAAQYASIQASWRVLNPWMHDPVPKLSQMVEHAARMVDGQGDAPAAPVKDNERDAHIAAVKATSARVAADAARTAAKFGQRHDPVRGTVTRNGH
jgi:hypothetical protein